MNIEMKSAGYISDSTLHSTFRFQQAYVINSKCKIDNSFVSRSEHLICFLHCINRTKIAYNVKKGDPRRCYIFSEADLPLSPTNWWHDKVCGWLKNIFLRRLQTFYWHFYLKNIWLWISLIRHHSKSFNREIIVLGRRDLLTFFTSTRPPSLWKRSKLAQNVDITSTFHLTSITSI